MKVRLLIADDNPTVRKLLRTLLETQTDWQVCGEAENGVEAVAKAAELKPDVVILDLAMPVMDGLHAALEISSASPGIPILMNTMHYFEGLDLEAKKVGIRRVLNKSHSADELLAAIHEALKPALQQQADTGLAQAAAQNCSTTSNGAVDPPATGNTDPNTEPN